MSSTALAPVTLFDLSRQLSEQEDTLIALLETEEGGIPAELEQEFRSHLYEVATSLAITKEARIAKLNAYYRIIEHFEQREENIKANIEAQKERAKVRRASCQRNIASLKQTLLYVLECIAKPDKQGKLKAKLECDLATFSLRGNPAKVEIQNEEMIPSQFKDITLTLPVDLWMRVLWLATHAPKDCNPLTASEVETLAHADVAATKTISVNADAVQDAIALAVGSVPEFSCPLRGTKFGEQICDNGQLWELTHSDSAPPDQRQSAGECPRCAKHAASVEEARRSVPGAYLPAVGKNSVVVR